MLNSRGKLGVRVEAFVWSMNFYPTIRQFQEASPSEVLLQLGENLPLPRPLTSLVCLEGSRRDGWTWLLCDVGYKKLQVKSAETLSLHLTQVCPRACPHHGHMLINTVSDDVHCSIGYPCHQNTMDLYQI